MAMKHPLNQGISHDPLENANILNRHFASIGNVSPLIYQVAISLFITIQTSSTSRRSCSSSTTRASSTSCSSSTSRASCTSCPSSTSRTRCTSATGCTSGGSKCCPKCCCRQTKRTRGKYLMFLTLFYYFLLFCHFGNIL